MSKHDTMKKSLPKLTPCVCGHQCINIGDYSIPVFVYICPNCGLKGLPFKTERTARDNWNKLIAERLKRKD